MVLNAEPMVFTCHEVLRLMHVLALTCFMAREEAGLFIWDVLRTVHELLLHSLQLLARLLSTQNYDQRMGACVTGEAPKMALKKTCVGFMGPECSQARPESVAGGVQADCQIRLPVPCVPPFCAALYSVHLLLL